MNITSIHYDEASGYFVFETNRRESLLISYDSYLKLDVHAPADVSDEVADALREEDATVRAYLIARRYALYQPRTADEVRRRLQREHMDDDVIADAMAKLTAQHLLDDAEYARRYASDKQRTAHWSHRRIRSELIHRGVDRADIDAALDYLPDAGEIEALRIVLRKKAAHFKADDPKAQDKLIRFLLQKGFPYDAIRHVLQDDADA